MKKIDIEGKDLQRSGKRERNKKRLEMPLSELLDNSVLYYEEIIKYVLESNIEDKTYLYFQIFYANSFENENFINSAINNHGFITEEEIGLLESVFYYIDSIKTIQEGLDILSNNKKSTWILQKFILSL